MPQPAYLDPSDTGVAATNPLNTSQGDQEFDRLMGQRRFEDRAVRPLGGRLARPEPVALPGAGSSLTGIGGASGGHRKGSGASIRTGGSYHG